MQSGLRKVSNALLGVWHRRAHTLFLIILKINKQLPAVISSCTYNVLVVMRKAYVGDVRRVPKIPLVFGLLEKEQKFRNSYSSVALQSDKVAS